MLDQPARVSLAFRQKRSGRMDAGRCAKPTRANRHNHACVRQVPVAALSFSGHAGANRLSFRGRVSRARTLKPGRYTLFITATNAARQTSAPRSLSFTIVG